MVTTDACFRSQEALPSLPIALLISYDLPSRRVGSFRGLHGHVSGDGRSDPAREGKVKGSGVKPNPGSCYIGCRRIRGGMAQMLSCPLSS